MKKWGRICLGFIFSLVVNIGEAEITLFLGNPLRNGQIEIDKGIDRGLKLKWRVVPPCPGRDKLGHLFYHQGMLYSSMHGYRRSSKIGRLYAFHPERGIIEWHIDNIVSVPAFADNVCYVYTTSKFVAIDLNTRQIKWRWPETGSAQYFLHHWEKQTEDSAPLIVDGVEIDGELRDLVIFCSPVSPLIALDRHTGVEVWRFNPPDNRYIQSVVPSYYQGKVFILARNENNSRDNVIYAIDVKTGEIFRKADGSLWEYRTSHGISSNWCALAINEDGILAFGSPKKYLFVIDANEGRLLWRKTLARFSNGTGNISILFYQNQLIISHGPESGRARKPHIIAYDVRTRRELWNYQTSKAHFFDIHLIDTRKGRLYFGANTVRTHWLACLDLNNNGKEIWRHEKNYYENFPGVQRWANIIWCQEVVADGKMFVYDHYGTVFCFEESGSRTEESLLEKEKAVSVDPNPFNPKRYILLNVSSKRQNVKCKIYNILGQVVQEIKISNLKSQISKSIYWDGKDSGGLEVPTGVYFYEVAGEDIRQMVVLK
jgi:outer membrane protein assembly factor BamB